MPSLDKRIPEEIVILKCSGLCNTGVQRVPSRESLKFVICFYAPFMYKFEWDCHSHKAFCIVRKSPSPPTKTWKTNVITNNIRRRSKNSSVCFGMFFTFHCRLLQYSKIVYRFTSYSTYVIFCKLWTKAWQLLQLPSLCH